MNPRGQNVNGPAILPRRRTPSTRPLACFMLSLLAAQILLPAATAYHTSRDDNSDNLVSALPIPTSAIESIENLFDSFQRRFPLLPPVPTPSEQVPSQQDVMNRTNTVPALDQLRDQLLASYQRTIDDLNRELAARNVSLGTVQPAIPGRVLTDTVDEGGRVGGIGEWRVLGEDGWRVGPTEGRNGTAGYTISDPATGRYGGVDTWLVSPALDLSAYILQTGTLPYASADVAALSEAGGTTGRSVGNRTSRPGDMPDTNMIPTDVVEVLDVVSDEFEPRANGRYAHQVTLMLNHQMNLNAMQDGAQVRIFWDRAPTSIADHSALLFPLNETGMRKSYKQGIRSIESDSGIGFTGANDWDLTAFDLTPFAGKTVWIAFRVVTSPRAELDPGSYFGQEGFSKTIPFGWRIDDIEVVAPAYGKNLKVFGFEGPRFRIDEKDPSDRIAPGVNATVDAIVLNAGGTAGLATAEIEVSGFDEGAITLRQSKFLQPGEVWRPNVTFTAPTTESTQLTVRAFAFNPGPGGNASIPDPTPSDNRLLKSYVVSTVRRLDLATSVGPKMVDDGEDVDVKATLRNDGNVPLNVTVKMTEFYYERNATGARNVPREIAHEDRTVIIPPLGTTDVTWRISPDERGEHVLNFTTVVADLAPLSSQTRFYVHASPPPLLEIDGDLRPNASEWSRALSQFPVPPFDDWVWRTVVEGSIQIVPGPTVLRALPIVEDENPSATKYKDLRLTMRFMSFDYEGNGAVAIGYAGSSVTESSTPEVFVDFWRTSFPLGPPNTAGSGMQLLQHTNLSWRTFTANVVPSEARGYVDLWSLKGLELRVSVPSPRNADVFYLDDLRLSGVPEGADPSQRRDIIRITGNDSATNVLPLSDGTVAPVVSDNTQSADQRPGSTCQPIVFNCWVKYSAEQLRQDASATLWKPAAPNDLVDDTSVVWRFTPPRGGSTRADRLVTPPIQLTGATDPVLFLDHAYAFTSFPYDSAAGNAYRIAQVGFVEMQYQFDDGNWSPFMRIIPEGDYPDTLAKTPGQAARRPAGGNAPYSSGDGFYHPQPCPPTVVSQECDSGGYVMNYDSEGNLVYMTFLPTPRHDLSTFRLDQIPGVNLTDRNVRLAFHVATGNPGAFDPPVWVLFGMRLTPVDKFAIDGTVANISLETPYDWRDIGVGPGTNVTVNLTVQNNGLFREEFSVQFGAAPIGEPITYGKPIPVGEIPREESRSILVPWSVTSDLEGRNVVLSARVFPTDENTLDENQYNDVHTIGKDLSLRVATVRDLSAASAVVPDRGDPAIPRLIPITIMNNGNVPLRDIEIERRIERLEPGRIVVVNQTVWKVAGEMAPDPLGVNILHLAPDVRQADLAIVPGVPGTYLLTVNVRAKDVFESDQGNNLVRRYFEASVPLVEEDFEGIVRWDTNDPGTWGTGDGFVSDKSLTARNRTSGTFAPNSDTWITTPLLPLSDLQAATVSLLTRYDLERGYDGVVVEISTDNRTWHRVPPLDDTGRPGDYPVEMVGSNPLAAGSDTPVRAFSGSSWDAQVQFDGWTPVSFDLSAVPNISETLVFRSLDPPTPGSGSVAPETFDFPRVNYASWMVTDAADPAGRWEIRNETVRHEVERWWSGPGNGDGVLRRLNRTFDFSAVPASEALVLTWWDRRAGTENSSLDGVGGLYQLRVAELGLGGTSWDDTSLRNRVAVLARDGDWTLRQLVLPGNLNRTRPVSVGFEFTSTDLSANSLGWDIRDIRLESFATVDGRVVPGTPPSRSFVRDDNDPDERALWNLFSVNWGWGKDLVRPRAAPWNVEVGTGPDGRPAPQWRLTLDSTTHNSGLPIDTRLVSPAVDLSTVGGGRTTLRLLHSYDLLWVENPLPSGRELFQAKAYQGGTVEIEVYNRTTDRWDTPRQIFARDPPTREPVLRPVSPSALVPNPATDGAPYRYTLVESGDSFERFPRAMSQRIAKPGTPGYLRTYEDPAPMISYAFSGSSNGFVTDEFDLTPFRGEKVRFVFHAWAGPLPGGNRHWTIADVDVVGSILSATDARMRFRVGTDASILEGFWQMDQFQLAGVRYDRSVGVHLNETPSQVDTDGMVTFRGFLRNYGAAARDMVAIGVRFTGPQETIPRVNASGDTPTLAETPQGYVKAFGPFSLKPAGKAGSEVPFEIRLHGNVTPGTHTIVVELLDGAIEAGAVTYTLARDDVPGRASRAWSLETKRISSATISKTLFEPVTLALPAPIAAQVEGLNTGTTTLNLSVRASAVFVGDQGPLDTRTATYQLVPPGSKYAIHVPGLRLPRVGDYLVGFQLLENGTPLGDPLVRPYRVGTNDTIYTTSFEHGIEGWTVGDDDGVHSAANMRPSVQESRFGNASIIYGITAGMAQMGTRIEDFAHPATMSTVGSLISPVVDLRGAAPGLVFSFWHKPRLDLGSNGAVFIRAIAPDSNEPRAECGWVALPLPRAPDGNNLFRQVRSDWQPVTLPLDKIELCALGPASKHRVQFMFWLDGRGESWHLDGVTVASGTPTFQPPLRNHEIGDGGMKQYPFVVENQGAVPKDLRLELDASLSKLSASQARWIHVEPSRLVLAPGEKARGTVFVDVPAQRGAFPQDLVAVITAVDATSPFLSVLSQINLSFRPQPRSDLAVGAAVDGKSLGGLPLAVEEATSHEVAAIITNQGLDTSLPTEVRLRILDKDGLVAWEHRQRIDALSPASSSGEAAVAAGSWKPPLGKRGLYMLEASVDPDALQVDYDRSNSVFRAPLEVVPLMRPDIVVQQRSLAITTVEGKPLHETVPGQIIRVSGVVANEGLAEAHQVTVRIVAGSAVLKEEVIPSLPAGAARAVFANQRAPAESTAYRIIAFTPDVEVRSDNNEHAIELPVFPPELVITASPEEMRLMPGAAATVAASVRNEGPYPLLVNLTLGGDSRLGTLSNGGMMALAPGESRNLTLQVAPTVNELAGERKLLLQAVSAEGVRARRTLVVDVEPRPEAAVVPHVARGPPGAVRLEVDVVNTGNVELRPEAVVRDASGTVLLRHAIDAVPAGASRFVALPVRLPDATPPGATPVSVSIEHAGRPVGDAPVDVQIEPWGRVTARANLLDVTQGHAKYAVTLVYDGNAKSTRHPVVLNVPPGVVVRPDRTSVELEPGQSASMTVDVQSRPDVASGRYILQLGFLDARDPSGADLPGNLTGIPLDLRRAQLELTSVRRDGAATVSAGDALTYVATVRNVGDMAMANVSIHLYVDGALTDRVVIERLAPGSSQEVRLTYDALPGLHGIVLAVDPHGAHKDDAPAFAETVDVASSLASGVEGLSRIPGPSLLGVLAIALVAAAILRRGPRREG